MGKKQISPFQMEDKYQMMVNNNSHNTFNLWNHLNVNNKFGYAFQMFFTSYKCENTWFPNLTGYK